MYTFAIDFVKELSKDNKTVSLEISDNGINVKTDSNVFVISNKQSPIRKQQINPLDTFYSETSSLLNNLFNLQPLPVKRTSPPVQRHNLFTIPQIPRGSPFIGYNDTDSIFTGSPHYFAQAPPRSENTSMFTVDLTNNPQVQRFPTQQCPSSSCKSVQIPSVSANHHVRNMQNAPQQSDSVRFFVQCPHSTNVTPVSKSPNNQKSNNVNTTKENQTTMSNGDLLNFLLSFCDDGDASNEQPSERNQSTVSLLENMLNNDNNDVEIVEDTQCLVDPSVVSLFENLMNNTKNGTTDIECFSDPSSIGTPYPKKEEYQEISSASDDEVTIVDEEP